ncbi:MAG: hypothetical protein ACYDEP_13085 [Acidimicrobiales bacterium]
MPTTSPGATEVPEDRSWSWAKVWVLSAGTLDQVSPKFVVPPTDARATDAVVHQFTRRFTR